MADNEQSEPEISITIWVLVFIVCILFDAASLIPGVGDIEDIPALIVVTLQFSLGFFSTKIGKAITVVQGGVILLKAIPIIQEFPLWTIGSVVALILEKIPALKAVKQVAEEAGKLESGGEVGELGELGAATEGAAATGAKEAEGVGAQAGGGAAGEAQGTPGMGVENLDGEAGGKASPVTGESGETPSSEEPSPLDEEGGNAMKNLGENLLEPAAEEEAPPAPGPYQEDKEQTEEVTASAEARKRIEADRAYRAGGDRTPDDGGEWEMRQQRARDAAEARKRIEADQNKK
jgi:hypothetical protein